MIWAHIFVFVVSCIVLALSGKWLVGAISRIAKFLGWREFVVAFIIIAFGTSIPNLFVGIISALNKIPELSFGDVIGGNVIDLTLIIALAAFVAGSISTDSKIVRSTSLFTLGIAVLPLLLVLDKTLSRIDGVILILAFFLYIWWLFSKEERFTKIYDGTIEKESSRSLKSFFRDIGILLAGMALLLVSAEVIVKSASYFAQSLGSSIAVIGLLIVAMGNCLPEMYFSIASAKAGQTWMILGNLMGSVIIAATLVLGIVALICPIQITNFSPFVAARFFLVASVLFFWVFLRTDRKITRKEAMFLLALYLAYVVVEILLK
ncbi:MAG: sodium:calcium antiporter [bacterium]|nr:sodium:calcium antiporter [bacterium]